jgi:hypothetical protein
MQTHEHDLARELIKKPKHGVSPQGKTVLPTINAHVAPPQLKNSGEKHQPIRLQNAIRDNGPPVCYHAGRFPISLMMNAMYYNTGWNAMLPLLMGVHMLFGLAFAVGVAFLLFWAFKKLPERTLWTWGWILVIIGGLFCLLTMSLHASFMGGGFSRSGGSWNGRNFPMMQGWQNDANDAVSSQAGGSTSSKK